jgi:ribonuclease D
MEEPHIVPQWIERAGELALLCSRARVAGVVAVDTEADSLHSYYHKLCLVQLSFGDTHALVDPLALGREGLAPLRELLQDRTVIKVLHGADYDLRILDRDLGARVLGLRDTQVAAQLLGEPATGLAALLAKELGVKLDKHFQRADWGQRPLSGGAMAYAARDTAFLIPMKERLSRRLERLGRDPWWLEECDALEEVRWTPPEPNPLSFERVKGARALAGAARDRLAALHGWREGEAARRDVPPFRILRTDAMLALAKEVPERQEELPRLGVAGSTLRSYGRVLLSLLRQPPAAPERRKRRYEPPDRELETRVRELRSTRDEVAARLGLDPAVVAPRSALEAVASNMPASCDDLAGCVDREWRAVVLAPTVLPLVERWQTSGTSLHAHS